MGGHFIDFRGHRFGSWRVLHPVCLPDGKPGSRGAPAGYRGKWVVRCDCGRTFQRVIGRIVSGHSKGCSECRKFINRQLQHEDFLINTARRRAALAASSSWTPRPMRSRESR
jgi:hypothetical protein